jgi:hypothetical protein
MDFQGSWNTNIIITKVVNKDIQQSQAWWWQEGSLPGR